jgi:hypothetical protein
MEMDPDEPKFDPNSVRVNVSPALGPTVGEIEDNVGGEYGKFTEDEAVYVKDRL